MSCHANFDLRSWAQAQPKQISTNPAHDERRAHPRYQYVKPIQVFVAKRALKGFTADIGEGGISFILDTIVVPGMVTVEIPDASLVLEGRIVGHVPAAHAGLYRHLMQFKENLRTVILEELLS